MPKTDEDAVEEETKAPEVVWECGESRCGYVIYQGSGDSPTMEELRDNHIRQHEDPEGWKAEFQGGDE